MVKSIIRPTNDLLDAVITLPQSQEHGTTRLNLVPSTRFVESPKGQYFPRLKVTIPYFLAKPLRSRPGAFLPADTPYVTCSAASDVNLCILGSGVDASRDAFI